jgi:hypothetical protein
MLDLRRRQLVTVTNASSDANPVGLEDVPYLAREFQSKFEELDLLQLPHYSICLKLMINGTPSAPFSAVTLTPLPIVNNDVAVRSHSCDAQ